MTNDFLLHVLVMKLPKKPKGMGLESSRVAEHVEMWGLWALGGWPWEPSAPSQTLPGQFSLLAVHLCI